MKVHLKNGRVIECKTTKELFNSSGLILIIFGKETKKVDIVLEDDIIKIEDLGGNQ